MEVVGPRFRAPVAACAANRMLAQSISLRLPTTPSRPRMSSITEDKVCIYTHTYHFNCLVRYPSAIYHERIQRGSGELCMFDGQVCV